MSLREGTGGVHYKKEEINYIKPSFYKELKSTKTLSSNPYPPPPPQHHHIQKKSQWRQIGLVNNNNNETEVPTSDSVPEICEQLPTIEETLDLWDDANEDWFSGQGATEEEKQIAIRLKQIAKRFNKQTLPALGWVQRRRLIEETRIVDKVLGRMMGSDNN